MISKRMNEINFFKGIQSTGVMYYCKQMYDVEFSNEIDLNPNDAAAYQNRGNTYKAQKKYDLAHKDYTKAIELNPNDYKAYFNRGQNIVKFYLSFLHISKLRLKSLGSIRILSAEFLQNIEKNLGRETQSLLRLNRGPINRSPNSGN